uniref:Coiled-coil domain containing 9 n=1 Tax=Esox lucius TaxID=8010 RepID=A0AAY5L7B3_ESOLU
MSTVVDLKTKEEKDAELDRRIEALRKKNEALVRRYQEIEEDKKKAEQEGIAVKTHPPRKARPHDGPPEGDRRRTEKENFTVTIDLSKPAGEKRVINEWKKGPPRGRRDSEEGDAPKQLDDSPPQRAGSGRLGRGGQRGPGQRQERREHRPDRPLADPRQAHDRAPRDDRGPGLEGPGEAPGEAHGRGAPRGGRRGRGGRGGREREDGGGPPGGDRKSKEWEEKRRQNIEKMNEEMEKIAEYERGQRPTEGDKPIRNFLDDPRRSGPVPDVDRKDGSRRHVRNWGGLDFDNVKTGSELEKEWTSRRPGGHKGSVDMTMSMTGRERAEYLRWKKEREEIDEERLARHRNATGQWRREWDAQKTDTMFKEDPAVAAEAMQPDKGGSRRARGRGSRTKPRGGASDDVKRPPQAPTFGDFLGQGRGPREGDRGRGRERGPRQSYSMHDNRWEGEKEDHDEKEKQDDEKEKPKKERTVKKEQKPKVSSSQKIEEKRSDAEEDDDEWSDVEGGEEEEVEDEAQEERGEDVQSPKKAPRSEMAAGKSVPVSPPPSVPVSPPPSAQQSEASPKEQRPLRPQVNITSPPETQDSSECPKPLSPFSPLDGHQPVTDWGEEMEMQSPRSSMGESPLKPPSAEGSPAQAKVQEDSRRSSLDSSPSKLAETEKERDMQTVVVTVAVPSEETLIQEAPVPSSEPVYSPTDPHEEEVVVTPPGQETAATPTGEQSDPDNDSAPVRETDPNSSEPAVTVETTSDTLEQPSSG